MSGLKTQPRCFFLRIVAGSLALLLAALHAAPTPASGWRQALPGNVYQFPRDHLVHPDFKTEWWYFTGRLTIGGGTADAREFGYELTFFRQGVLPDPPAGASRFIVRDFKFAHFAISDIGAGQFHFSQKVSRGAYGESGFGTQTPGPLAWIDDWKLDATPDGRWHIIAAQDGRKIDLILDPQTAPIIEGEQGISRKSAADGHASCYYSFPRMATTGTVTMPGMPGAQPAAVTGETWFDHEWATNQLAPNQAGWDWFSLQLSDGTDLMLYRMRLKDGATDTASSGTFIAKNGQPFYLKSTDFILTPLESWHSDSTAANYPIRWRIEIPRLKLNLEISTPLKNQELALPSLAYWEGLIHATGTSAGNQGAAAAAQVAGHGYLELTGYGAPLNGLSSP